MNVMVFNDTGELVKIVRFPKDSLNPDELVNVIEESYQDCNLQHLK